MQKYIVILFLCIIVSNNILSQDFSDSVTLKQEKLVTQFTAVIEFADAAISSIAALNSLIKKENYRNKISAFNNPTSSDLGFNLQLEIQSALKPLLDKSKKVNSNKFIDVVGSLINNQGKGSLLKGFSPTGGIFSTLTSLVGNLTVSEKHITKTDLDSFILNIGKYFGQYEKLNRVNQQFDINIDKVDLRLQELQVDLKAFLIDLSLAYNSNLQRNILKQKNIEEIFLNYLDKQVIIKNISDALQEESNLKHQPYFPGDALKTAKDITATTQKIFTEYQKIYASNYNEIKNILQESKSLGKNINTKQVDFSLDELKQLYNDSKNADVLNLRLNTLSERLKTLVNTEKPKN